MDSLLIDLFQIFDPHNYVCDFLSDVHYVYLLVHGFVIYFNRCR